MHHKKLFGKVEYSIAYTKTDGLEVNCYVLLFLKVC